MSTKVTLVILSKNQISWFFTQFQEEPVKDRWREGFQISLNPWNTSDCRRNSLNNVSEEIHSYCSNPDFLHLFWTGRWEGDYLRWWGSLVCPIWDYWKTGTSQKRDLLQREPAASRRIEDNKNNLHELCNGKFSKEVIVICVCKLNS